MSRLENSAKPLIKDVLLRDPNEALGRNEGILSKWCILKACSHAYAVVQKNPSIANWPIDELPSIMASIAPKALSEGDVPTDFTVAVALLTDGELWGKHNLFHAVVLPNPRMWIAFMGVLGKFCFWVVNNEYGREVLEWTEEEYFPCFRVLGRGTVTPLVEVSRENALKLFLALRPIEDCPEIYKP